YKPEVKKVLTAKDIVELQTLVRTIPVSDYLVEYTVRLVSATRPVNNAPDFVKKYIRWGAGPRASQYLILAAKTFAALDGRPTPSVNDVKRVILPVLRHRIVRSFNAEAEGITADEIIKYVAQFLKE
ncbi:MAG: AAA family ATPase, partial [bacterium]